MASEIKGHISFEERTKWNKVVTDLSTHTSNSKIHVPTPPSDANYYLGSDLQWHKVPSASIVV